MAALGSVIVMRSIFLAVLLMVIAVTTALTSIWNHEDNIKWRKQIELLLWTGTMDRERTLKLCAAIMLTSFDSPRRRDIYQALPVVCRNSE